MKTFRFILKSGASFDVESEHLTLRHINNELTSYHFEGIRSDLDIALYIRVDDVSAVIQLGTNIKEVEKTLV